MTDPRRAKIKPPTVARGVGVAVIENEECVRVCVCARMRVCGWKGRKGGLEIAMSLSVRMRNYHTQKSNRNAVSNNRRCSGSGHVTSGHVRAAPRLFAICVVYFNYARSTNSNSAVCRLLGSSASLR